MTSLVAIKPGRVLPALVVGLVLAGCAMEPKVPLPGGTAPRTAECTQPGGWAALDRRDHGIGLDGVLRAAAALR